MENTEGRRSYTINRAGLEHLARNHPEIEEEIKRQVMNEFVATSITIRKLREKSAQLDAQVKDLYAQISEMRSELAAVKMSEGQHPTLLTRS